MAGEAAADDSRCVGSCFRAFNIAPTAIAANAAIAIPAIRAREGFIMCPEGKAFAGAEVGMFARSVQYGPRQRGADERRFRRPKLQGTEKSTISTP
jgi:hypothetical protein